MSELHVVFGTGPLGKWTARELVKLGKTVRMVNRTGKTDRIPESVEVVACDAYEIAKNIEITKGAHAIYQCSQPRYYEWAAKFPSLQAAILEAAIVNNAKFVVAENLYMYGRFEGALREDSAINPNTKKGKIRAEMARAVMDAHQTGKVRAAVGRASDFFGPDDFALTGYAMLPAVRGKAANLIGRIDMPHTFTYLADFGKLLATLGTRDQALGHVWFAPSNPAITQADLIGLIEVELGRPVKTMVGSPMMMKFLGLFDRNIKETVEMMFMWQHSYVVDTSKVERAFGLMPTPMKDAVRETLSWCRQVVKG